MEPNKEGLKNISSPQEEGKNDDGMEDLVAAFQYYVEGVGILVIGTAMLTIIRSFALL